MPLINFIVTLHIMNHYDYIVGLMTENYNKTSHYFAILLFFILGYRKSLRQGHSITRHTNTFKKKPLQRRNSVAISFKLLVFSQATL